MLANQIQSTQHPARKIVYRTRGETGGPITRLMSPSDIGNLIKPFFFLDRFRFDGQGPRMPMEARLAPALGDRHGDRRAGGRGSLR